MIIEKEYELRDRLKLNCYQIIEYHNEKLEKETNEHYINDSKILINLANKMLEIIKIVDKSNFYLEELFYIRTKKYD